jgi:hypothetical protein
MAMTIQIVLDGICISFKTPTAWRVIFFCDSRHEANFEIPSIPMAGRLGNGNNRSVTLEGVTAGAPRKGREFGLIFNLSRDYAHGEESAARSNLDLFDNAGSALKFITIDIPNSEMERGVLTDRDYWIQPSMPVGHPVRILGKVASKVTVTFDVAGPVTMRATNPDETVTIPFTDGVTKSILFDNDCGASCNGDNDFAFVYERLRHRSDPTRKFYAGQVLNAMFNGEHVIASKTEEEAKAGRESVDLGFHPLYGNCDPVVVEPPPGP